MTHDNYSQDKPALISWLRRIAFAEYERVEYLQEAISNQLYTQSAGEVEAAVLQRQATIKLWHGIVPLYFGFVPLWLIWVVPLFKLPLPSLQVVVVLGTIFLSGICYLLTFRSDGIRFQSNLAHVRQNLLLIFQKEQSPALPVQILPAIQQDITVPIPTPKGSVRLLLLDQLVRKEADYPNIFDAAIEEVLPFYKKQTGFNEKNFKKTMPQYRRRQDIVLDQENARTTHIGYLDLIIRQHHATGEQVLEQQATNLQTFLNTTPLQSASKIKERIHL